MSQVSEPLDPQTWFAQIERVSEMLGARDGEAPDAYVRRAFHIANLAPVPLRPLVGAEMDEKTLEIFLDCGALVSAVLGLFGKRMALKISRAADSELVKVDVSLPTANASGTGTQDGIEWALLQAWTECLLVLRPASLESSDHPAPHIIQFSPRRNSTEH